MLHSRLRTLWGFPDPPDLAVADKLKGRYRGLRVAFGYPACPNLADQAILWKLLGPEQVGIALTESYMMDPEASGVGPRLSPPGGALLQGVAGAARLGPERRARRRAHLPGLVP